MRMPPRESSRSRMAITALRGSRIAICACSTFESFGGFGKEVRSTLREAANQLSNKLSHAQHLDEVTWTTKNWHGLQMQRLSVVLHTAVAWQTVNELACGESGIVHGAECIAVLNGVA